MPSESFSGQGYENRHQVRHACSEALARIVEDYVDNPVCCHYGFDALVDTLDFVCGRHNPAPCPGPVPRYRKHGHERRFSNERINSIVRELDGVTLLPADDFDSVIERVRRINPRGLGDLSSYDFTLRLCGSRGVFPRSYVYIHSGALTGAGHLRSLGLLDFGRADKRIPVQSLPPEMLPLVDLEGMGTLHVENFLCVSKHKLEKLVIDYSPNNLNNIK